ncbi:hypothetical protein [Sphingomonas sp. LHG3406-1]|uniref:hypothetical protein n=1 Tax=Sphingomonas sp. LHG3406-1 TaxID=2804617 RepID=UPI002627CE04|nr:hypothetical protein [Sphingomonas sp. LHG3406-1]
MSDYEIDVAASVTSGIAFAALGYMLAYLSQALAPYRVPSPTFLIIVAFTCLALRLNATPDFHATLAAVILIILLVPPLQVWVTRSAAAKIMFAGAALMSAAFFMGEEIGDALSPGGVDDLFFGNGAELIGAIIVLGGGYLLFTRWHVAMPTTRSEANLGVLTAEAACSPKLIGSSEPRAPGPGESAGSKPAPRTYDSIAEAKQPEPAGTSNFDEKALKKSLYWVVVLGTGGEYVLRSAFSQGQAPGTNVVLFVAAGVAAWLVGRVSRSTKAALATVATLSALVLWMSVSRFL